MTIDYSTLTLDEISRMSEEEFNQLDPSKLPTGNGPSEITSDLFDLPPSDEVPAEDTNAPVIPQPEVDPEPTDQLPAEEGIPQGRVEEPQVSTEQGEVPNAGGSQTPTEVATPELTPNKTDAESFYEKVTAKFNASGKEFQVDNADDVVSLMQKGIDYNIKMSTLKPALKMVKALEAQGITQDDLGLLIDLHNRKPEAIARIVKDADIDLYSVEEDKVDRYAPTDARITDEEYEFQSVIQNIQGGPQYADIMQFVGNASADDQREVYNHPEILTALSEHARLGIFNQVLAEVDKARVLGRLPRGMTPLQAYHAIGAQMFGGEPTPQQAQYQGNPQVAKPTPVAQPVQRAQAPASQPNVKRAAAAAPSTNSTGATPKKYTQEEIWNMSPEDFNKIDPKYL